MASRYETTKMCPALSFEGHSYRFDKLVAANVRTHSNNIKYKQINEKIKNLTLDFNLGQKDVDEYMTGIAHNISQPTSISL